jgi:hypothetical protein
MDSDTEKDSTGTASTPMKQEDSSRQRGQQHPILLTSAVTFIRVVGALKNCHSGFESRKTGNGTRVVIKDMTQFTAMKTTST